MYYVGIDIAKNNHEATMIDESGTIIGKSITFANSPAGADKLINFITRHSPMPLSEVAFGLEATGHYWLSLYSCLIDKGYTVHVINPIQSDSLRNLYIRKTKNDSRDSFIIAELIRFGRFTETQLAEENILALKQLCRYRSYLVDQVTGLKIKAITILDQIFPEYSNLFSDIFGTSSKALLSECSSPEDILNINVEKLSELLSKSSRGQLGYAKAQQLQLAAKNTFGIKIAIDAFSFQLKQIIEGHVKDVDDQIKTYFDPLDSHLTSIPGIGVTTAATIHSEIGEISRFDNPSKLCCIYGNRPFRQAIWFI